MIKTTLDRTDRADVAAYIENIEIAVGMLDDLDDDDLHGIANCIEDNISALRRTLEIL